MNNSPDGGLLLVDKPINWTSHDCVAKVRRRIGLAKVGHAGTLDPFATGVLVLLVGKRWTTQAAQLQGLDKSYQMVVRLGSTTDSHDSTGKVMSHSPIEPMREELEAVLGRFQGDLMQVPPMFSAKQIGGQRLYNLARQGKVIERVAQQVWMHVELLSYSYPLVELHVRCSKGTYMRTLAHDIGEMLGCGAHAESLKRLSVGPFQMEACIASHMLSDPSVHLGSYLIQPCLENLSHNMAPR